MAAATPGGETPALPLEPQADELRELLRLATDFVTGILENLPEVRISDTAGVPELTGGAGVLTSRGSVATLSALITARSERLPENFLAGTMYVTEHAHQAVAKALRLAGFPADAVRQVAVDHDLRMDVDALRSAVAADRSDGRKPFCVVATAGTTNTGAIDPLPDIADVAAKEGLWLHVDAAYGGFFHLTDRGRKRLAGIERPDSTVLDPH